MLLNARLFKRQLGHYNSAHSFNVKLAHVPDHPLTHNSKCLLTLSRSFYSLLDLTHLPFSLPTMPHCSAGPCGCNGRTFVLGKRADEFTISQNIITIPQSYNTHTGVRFRSEPQMCLLVLGAAVLKLFGGI